MHHLERTCLEIIARGKGLNDGANEIVSSNGTKHRKNDVSDRLIAGNAIAFVAFPGFDERQFFYRIGEERLELGEVEGWSNLEHKP